MDDPPSVNSTREASGGTGGADTKNDKDTLLADASEPPSTPETRPDSSQSAPASATTDAAEASDAANTQNPPGQEPEPESGAKLSKNQMKKRRRYEKLQALKKRKKQQAKDIKNAKAKAQGRDLDAERQLQLERERSGEGKKRRDAQWLSKLEKSRTNNSFQICIDCGFEHLMTFKEQNSLAGQIRYCYAQNRRSDNPVRMSVAGLKKDGSTYEQMAKVNGFPEQWFTRAFTCSEEPLEEMHRKKSQPLPSADTSNGDTEKCADDGANENASASASTNTDAKENNDLSDIVYLTSDAEYTLEHLDDDKVYVIGGIVDRNRLKGTTMKKAQSLGIQTAKLPIEEYLKLVATKVLTVNHVFEILLKYRTHGNDWKKAMLDVLPARKDITELDKGGSADTDADGNSGVGGAEEG